MRGIVKWFRDQTGIGYIAIEGQESAYVHHSNIQDSENKHLRVGEYVEFDLEDHKIGRVAKNIRRVNKESLQEEQSDAKLPQQQ